MLSIYVLQILSFQRLWDQQISYFEVGISATDPINTSRFTQLDFVVAPKDFLQHVLDITSHREAVISSHHFLVSCSLNISIPKKANKSLTRKLDIACLRDKHTATLYAQAFASRISSYDIDDNQISLDDLNNKLETSFHEAAFNTLRSTEFKAKRPWISVSTLQLIKRRHEARSIGDIESQRYLQKLVRQFVKKDREIYLKNLVSSGDWAKLRELRKSKNLAQGRLRNLNNDLVSSEERAETIADYLERVQWRVRPTFAVLDREPIGPILDIRVTEVTLDEVTRALKKLRYGKVCGQDKIYPELWKALIEDHTALSWIVKFCQRCWKEKKIPENWHRASVISIFKKGDPALCENYRPISLLAIGYKVFALVLLYRLKDGQAESRIWATQFGFKSEYGTTDALFAARRIIDQCWTKADGSVILLALDWAKAFDSVSPYYLCNALRRFGLPEDFV